MVVVVYHLYVCFFFFKQKTAYEMRISDWSSDVCSSDLGALGGAAIAGHLAEQPVERHRGRHQAEHAGDHADGQEHNGQIARAPGGHDYPPLMRTMATDRKSVV